MVAVKIDSVSQPTYNPETDFSLNNLEPSGQIAIRYFNMVDNIKKHTLLRKYTFIIVAHINTHII